MPLIDGDLQAVIAVVGWMAAKYGLGTLGFLMHWL
jgi:hypothetical protein